MPVKPGSRVRLRQFAYAPLHQATGQPMARYADRASSTGLVLGVGRGDPDSPLAGRLLWVWLDSGEDAWVMESEVRMLHHPQGL